MEGENPAAGLSFEREFEFPNLNINRFSGGWEGPEAPVDGGDLFTGMMADLWGEKVSGRERDLDSRTRVFNV